MKLNIKNTSPSLSQTKGGSNIVSVAVAIVTFILVVGGVFLITKSLGNRGTDVVQAPSLDATPSVKSATETRSSESNSLVLKDKSSDSITTTENKPNTENKETKEAPVQVPTTSTDPKPTEIKPTENHSDTNQKPKTPTESSNPSTPTITPTTAKPTTLSSNQSILKVLSQSGNRYRVQVVDTGTTDGRYLVKDATITLNLSGFTLGNEKTYKLTGIGEKNGLINVNLANMDAIENITK